MQFDLALMRRFFRRPNQEIPVEQPALDFSTAALLREMIPLKLVGHKEAIGRILNINASLREELAKKDFIRFLPANAFSAALLSESEMLKRLNGGGIHMPVAWDDTTGLPSCPTLLADAAKCSDFIQGKYSKLILQSFREWVLFWEETVKCGHGSRTFQLKDVAYGVWINHGFSREKNSLLIKQFMCVRSDDEKHIERHYSSYQPSDVLDKSNLVWSAINKITVTEDTVALEDMGITAAREVYDPQKQQECVFANRMIKIIRSVEGVWDGRE